MSCLSSGVKCHTLCAVLESFYLACGITDMLLFREWWFFLVGGEHDFRVVEPLRSSSLGGYFVASNVVGCRIYTPGYLKILVKSVG